MLLVYNSALTNHGVLQAKRLGTHLAATDVKISQIYSSNLQRAYKTAEAIRIAQDEGHAPREVTKLQLLREQDFGYYEGKTFLERSREAKESAGKAHRNDPAFKDVESKDSMNARMAQFIDDYLVNSLEKTLDENSIVVVAHGIILSHLWRTLLRRFQRKNVSVDKGVQTNEYGLEHLGGWANTGYLNLEIRSVQEQGPAQATSIPPAAIEKSLSLPTNPIISGKTPSDLASTPESSTKGKDLSNMLLIIKSINSQEHLKGLKKTRGGLGSLKHESSQTTMDSFFKKRKRE
ncbi:phosphoglycerate mutase family protein [Rutstroemia sp. NJR-2017a WRK4]|nr:phosphoglycerate mutase family protein [Rutstroemia sp. NJR-2017a WRK4]